MNSNEDLRWFIELAEQLMKKHGVYDPLELAVLRQKLNMMEAEDAGYRDQ